MAGAVPAGLQVLMALWQAVGPAAAHERLCTAGSDEQIIVCATDDAEQFRIPAVLRREDRADGPRRIIIDLGDGRTLHVNGEQGDVGGWPSRRIMIGITAPL